VKRLLSRLLILNGLVASFIPRQLKLQFIRFIILLSGYSSKPKKDLSQLLLIKDELEKIINNRALAYGNGEHPKHYLTSYHQFFVDNIENGDKVLDVGCGYGSVSRSIALAKPDSIILGVDNDLSRLSQAEKSNNPENLNFEYGDATNKKYNNSWDVVVLSNVLEHIEHRISFLKLLKSNTKARKFLIRVPSYERDWQVPLRKELKINYFSDDDHKIEHTITEFKNEMMLSNLQIIQLTTQWGEIWATCKPILK
jgi:2-polyprenyl-3-methyl-5-hydroxy-6-metoxy-1,4-benzoquinol methylase